MAGCLFRNGFAGTGRSKVGAMSHNGSGRGSYSRCVVISTGSLLTQLLMRFGRIVFGHLLTDYSWGPLHLLCFFLDTTAMRHDERDSKSVGCIRGRLSRRTTAPPDKTGGAFMRFCEDLCVNFGVYASFAGFMRDWRKLYVSGRIYACFAEPFKLSPRQHRRRD